jgi:tRNA 2-thiouridine synthesizing protein B
MVLHTLNASPSSAAFADCLRLIAPGDALLLLGDAVYGAISGSTGRQALDTSAARLYVLQQDAAAAGVTNRVEGATLVDMDGFVELTERISRQLAWY